MIEKMFVDFNVENSTSVPPKEFASIVVDKLPRYIDSYEVRTIIIIYNVPE